MDKAIKNRILVSVEALQDELVRAVSEMVKIPSVTPEFGYQPEQSNGGESQVNRYTETLMRQMGLETDLFATTVGRDNLVGIYKGQGEGRSLLFNGHVDVVPPTDEETWAFPPFSGEVHGGFIHGRGTVDMKGGNAAALFALKALLNAGLLPKGNVVFQHVVGEEVKNTEAGTGACLDRGYLADGAICCEPTCSDQRAFEVNPASSGIFEMKWRVKGKPCHAGLLREVIRDGGRGRDVGVDAIEKGMIIYHAIKTLEKEWGQSKVHPLYQAGNFCINGAKITAGTAPSFIADHMEMSYAIFYPPQDHADDIKKELEITIQNACLNDPWLRENSPEVEWLFNWPSFDVDPLSDICQVATQNVQQITPDGGALVGMFAVCDASFIAEKGVPVVVLGPGNIKYAHAINEKISIEELMEACKIYALIIADWCGVDHIE